MGKIFLRNKVDTIDMITFEVEGSIGDMENLIQHLRFTEGVKDLSKKPIISADGYFIKVITFKDKYSVIIEELFKYHGLRIIKLLKTFEK